MRWSLALALVVPIAFAGCGGTDSGANQVRLGDGSRVSLDLPEEQRPAPDDIRGAISGIVVSEAIFPLPGALVSVQGRDLAATTDQDGLFAFEAMPPGLYTLVVRLDGYGEGLGTVNVRSGQVVKSILQVHRLPVLDPYHTTLKFEELHDPVDFWLSGTQDHVVPFDLPPATVILEADWPGLGGVATNEVLDYRVQPESDPEAAESGGGTTPLYVPFQADFFPPGEYAVRFEVHPSPLAPSAESRGQVFLTVFYVDPAPEGWSVVAGDA